MVDPAYDDTAPWSATASRVASVGAKVHRQLPTSARVAMAYRAAAPTVVTAARGHEKFRGLPLDVAPSGRTAHSGRRNQSSCWLRAHTARCDLLVLPWTRR